MPSNSRILSQPDVDKWFHEGSGSGGWTELYVPHPGLIMSGRAVYAGLIPLDAINEILTDTTWNLEEGRDGPGLDISGNYHRRTSFDGIEPLVHVRQYYERRPEYVEISEELKLIFNLFQDFSRGLFFFLEDDGKETEVIRIANNVVSIRTTLLNRYLAAREMALLLQLESDIWIQSKEDIRIPNERSEHTDLHRFEFWAGKSDSYYFSRLLGKKVVLPPVRARSGIWPYHLNREYADFIVGEDEIGNPIRHTCDPLQVAGSMSAGTNATHSLTSVFFSREVLQKYFSDPDRYAVRDGTVSCGNLWLLRADTAHPDHVAVFLGDLGTDLPYSEQQYWRAFELSPIGRSMSQSAWERSFAGAFVASDLAEHRFKRAYVETNKVWEQVFGWPLFKELHSDDRYILVALRTPLNNTFAEFDNQLIYLSKLLIDSLNEKAIASSIKGARENNQKGIAKLSQLLSRRELNYPYAERDMPLLHSIQGIRSKGSAHRKGSDYDIRVAGLDPENLQEGLKSLLNRTSQMLDDLGTFALSKQINMGAKERLAADV